jgi:hypothetical protein
LETIFKLRLHSFCPIMLYGKEACDCHWKPTQLDASPSHTRFHFETESVFHRISWHLLSFSSWSLIRFGSWCYVMLYGKEACKCHSKINLEASPSHTMFLCGILSEFHMISLHLFNQLSYQLHHPI